MKIEIIDEENYFFLFSKFTDKLLSFYDSHPDFVVPDFRFNEIKAFVKRGLEDFSISRLASKMPWGVPVPGDENHVMYVWFDALVSYISAIGWPKDEESFTKWWTEIGGVVQYCGKDNLRQQSAMWQSMLMAAGLPQSKQIVINGFVTGEGGIKMSKSLGNVISPLDIVNEYGTDALRYYVAREIHPFEDSPFTPNGFKEAYNAHLANGIGNLVSRIMKMATTYSVSVSINTDTNIPQEYTSAMDSYNIHAACGVVWNIVNKADKKIHETEPFKLIKTDPDKAKSIVSELLVDLNMISVLLSPILPQTSGLIKECLKEGKMPAQPLFLRK
jgi:methionyl-tRNA synthetase